MAARTTFEVAGYLAEVEALRLAVIERARVQLTVLEREVVVLGAGVVRYVPAGMSRPTRCVPSPKVAVGATIAVSAVAKTPAATQVSDERTAIFTLTPFRRSAGRSFVLTLGGVSVEASQKHRRHPPAPRS
jgi:hypothetical protein